MEKEEIGKGEEQKGDKYDYKNKEIFKNAITGFIKNQIGKVWKLR